MPADSEDDASTQAVAVDTAPRERRDGDLDSPPAHDGADNVDGADGPPLSADPHSARAGTTEDQTPAEPRVVAFVAPPADLRVVRVEQRPVLSEPAMLALATVRNGEVVFEGEAVLSFGQVLAKESAVRGVVGLEPPDQAEASLEDLARAAHAMKRHLLLVDVRPGSETDKRVGFLLDARSGVLLARWTIEARGLGSRPASSSSDSDLCARLALSYARFVN